MVQLGVAMRGRRRHCSRAGGHLRANERGKADPILRFHMACCAVMDGEQQQKPDRRAGAVPTCRTPAHRCGARRSPVRVSAEAPLHVACRAGVRQAAYWRQDMDSGGLCRAASGTSINQGYRLQIQGMRGEADIPLHSGEGENDRRRVFCRISSNRTHGYPPKCRSE